jgi:hypothetical protein
MTYVLTGPHIEEAAPLWRARGAIVILGEGWLWAYLPHPTP